MNNLRFLGLIDSELFVRIFFDAILFILFYTLWFIHSKFIFISIFGQFFFLRFSENIELLFIFRKVRFNWVVTIILLVQILINIICILAMIIIKNIYSILILLNYRFTMTPSWYLITYIQTRPPLFIFLHIQIIFEYLNTFEFGFF